MSDKIKAAISLRDKAKKQLEGFDRLVVSLSIEDLDPDFFNRGEPGKVSIESRNPTILTKNRHLLAKYRRGISVKINDLEFPASQVTDDLWEHLLEEHSKKR